MSEVNSNALEGEGLRQPVRLHLTNIVGLGAVRLLQSLLPALLYQNNYKLEEVYIPDNGELSNYSLFEHTTVLTRYKRLLPNSISRLLECTLFGNQFDGSSPLFVLGDIPIRCKSKQTVFIQNSLLTREAYTGINYGGIKYLISMWLFRLNMRYVTNFIVQTDAMKSSLIDTYPQIMERIHVIAQPAPSWLIKSQLKRTEFLDSTEVGLRLFYPAAYYHHKNHRILSEVKHYDGWAISELILTISEKLNPNASIPWIRCVDLLSPDAVIDTYSKVDGLLFLSLSESFGFPLVEAMCIGLPIICPDLPYSRTLCGENAIYFNPHNVTSLQTAIEELNQRRRSGWWPDWSSSLAKLPRDWQEVADRMLQIVTAE